MIRQIKTIQECQTCQAVLHTGFATAAQEFGLTEQNCPSHTAFIPLKRLQEQFREGRPMFLLFREDMPIGYYSLKQKSEQEWELNHLTVLPEYRRKGYGRKLLAHAAETVKSRGGNRIEIGIIEENTALKNWYLQAGFVHTGTGQFPSLPFIVGYMEWGL